MPAYRYVTEYGSAIMLATKRLTGVTPEVNLRERVAHMLPSREHQGWGFSPEVNKFEQVWGSPGAQV